jgi:hypothetical protein
MRSAQSVDIPAITILPIACPRYPSFVHNHQVFPLCKEEDSSYTELNVKHCESQWSNQWLTYIKLLRHLIFRPVFLSISPVLCKVGSYGINFSSQTFFDAVNFIIQTLLDAFNFIVKSLLNAVNFLIQP